MNVDELVEYVLKIDELNREATEIAKNNKIKFSYNIYKPAFLCDIVNKNLYVDEIDEFFLKLVPHMPIKSKYCMFNNSFNSRLTGSIGEKVWKSYLKYIMEHHERGLFTILNGSTKNVKEFATLNYGNQILKMDLEKKLTLYTNNLEGSKRSEVFESFLCKNLVEELKKINRDIIDLPYYVKSRMIRDIELRKNMYTEHAKKVNEQLLRIIII